MHVCVVCLRTAVSDRASHFQIEHSASAVLTANFWLVSNILISSKPIVNHCSQTFDIFQILCNANVLHTTIASNTHETEFTHVTKSESIEIPKGRPTFIMFCQDLDFCLCRFETELHQLVSIRNWEAHNNTERSLFVWPSKNRRSQECNRLMFSDKM